LALTRGPHLDSVAQRIEPKATWDDIALPPGVLAQLRRIADRISEGRPADPALGRGPGFGVLFSGKDAPAKLRAAEAIANHLGLAVYRVDLSAVVSKYIGETEKNLGRVFDVAEDGGTILLFDEADALFGKRSEVKDSHDRYADIELDYLLQRIESRAGLTILAASAGTPLPSTFVQRLWFVVSFPPQT
jgi:SpoVK/Ycf46/Vps4 family AAA+-type ATPase